VLTIDNFYPLNYKCKSCYLTTQKEYRKTNHEQVKAIEQRSKKKNKEQRKIYNDAYRLSYSGFYRGLLNSCRASDKKYKRDGFNLNLEWLEKQRDKQNNKCIYTKLYLVWTTNNKRKASIDRINNSLSHTIENCHLCIYPINLMKCDMDHEEFLKHFNNIKKKKFKSYAKTDLNNLSNDEKELIDRKYSDCRQHSRANKFEFNLTKDEYYNFIKKNTTCNYTGTPVAFKKNVFNNASIDRIDSSRGYSIDNIQMTIWPINRMKRLMDHDEFKELIDLIWG
jgi:hypothetical protein